MQPHREHRLVTIVERSILALPGWDPAEGSSFPLPKLCLRLTGSSLEFQFTEYGLTWVKRVLQWGWMSQKEVLVQD